MEEKLILEERVQLPFKKMLEDKVLSLMVFLLLLLLITPMSVIDPTLLLM
jgi:hypothetical protein